MFKKVVLSSLVAIVSCVAAGGCASSPARARYGKTFHVGGAGYVGPIGTFNVAYGLLSAGYKGQVEVFLWQSGKGVFSDQMALGRNRARARELAAKMQTYLAAHPGGALNVVALSAGCGITAFAIESLPEKCKLNNVVFLGCSLSHRYDLTKVLRHLRGSLYVYSSPSDIVLLQIMPFTGTIDRKNDVAAGLYGFVPPAGLSDEGRRLYGKVINIRWREEFARYGYFGQHVDTVSFRFIRDEVARRVMTPPLERTPLARLAYRRREPPAKPTKAAPSPAGP